MIRKKIVLMLFLVMFLGFTNLSAQTSDKLAIHGFGGWAYGKTNGNPYLFGSKEGDYDNSKFFLPYVLL